MQPPFTITASTRTGLVQAIEHSAASALHSIHHIVIGGGIIESIKDQNDRQLLIGNLRDDVEARRFVFSNH